MVKLIITTITLCLLAAQTLAASPTVTTLTAPLVFSGFSDGAVFDVTGQKLVASVPLPAVVVIDGTHNPNGSGQTFDVTIKLGIVDGANMAADGVHITGIEDSQITISSIGGVTTNGLYAYSSGCCGLFNNFIRIGAIRNNGENGAIFVSPSSGVFGVQGNHIEIGQVIANGASGIALFGVSAYNYLVVGPVEHNALYGCYQQAANTWLIVNSNSNGMRQVC